jgi:hypothetical protein
MKSMVRIRAGKKVIMAPVLTVTHPKDPAAKILRGEHAPGGITGNRVYILIAAYIGLGWEQIKQVDALPWLQRTGYMEGDQLTDKGHVFVEMLLKTPEPVEKWADPREEMK